MSLIGVVLLLLPFLLAAILFFVFWIIMLVDSINRKFKGDSEKIVWVLVLVFTGVLGAFIYYFVVYVHDKSKSLKWFWITMLILAILILLIVVLFFISYREVISSGIA
jgi:magnesium-transporting ATPase (P-type)